MVSQNTETIVPSYKNAGNILKAVKFILHVFIRFVSEDFILASLGRREVSFYCLTKLDCIQAVDYTANIYFKELLSHTLRYLFGLLLLQIKWSK